MTDVNREKYLRLMQEIEELEDRVQNFEQEAEVVKDAGAIENSTIISQEFMEARKLLAQKRNELTRISNGCGGPHL